MTGTLPTLHTDFIARIRSAVADDPRFDALLAGGSYIHGGFDDHSDLDFVLVTRDDMFADVMASRQAFARGLGALVSAFTGEHVGEPRLLICLYGPPLLHVDLKFVTADDLDHRIERPAVLFTRDEAAVAARLDAAAIAWPDLPPQWFEDRAWVWLHYATTKWARGELFEAVGMLSFFREQVLGPLLHAAPAACSAACGGSRPTGWTRTGGWPLRLPRPKPKQSAPHCARRSTSTATFAPTCRQRRKRRICRGG